MCNLVLQLLSYKLQNWANNDNSIEHSHFEHQMKLLLKLEGYADV